jgi:hypothetical protein
VTSIVPIREAFKPQSKGAELVISHEKLHPRRVARSNVSVRDRAFLVALCAGSIDS